MKTEINFSGAGSATSGCCPNCGAPMEHHGSDMKCPFCGYSVANLDQNININQNVTVTNLTKPQYDFVMRLTGPVQPVVFPYSIVRQADRTIVDRGKAVTTAATNAMPFNLPNGVYVIRIGKYNRTVYIDDMHTVSFEFIYTGSRCHINIRGEAEPPAEQGEAVAAAKLGNKKVHARKPVFLVLGILFALTSIAGIAGRGANSAGTIVTAILLSLLFFALYFKKDIKKLLGRKENDTGAKDGKE